ncbi:ABC transporter permease [Corynebacterium sp. 70RC1]|uniref:ABC transporter permease n=2 Tax=unclassified Corynebacterium TaxID=2624378 RepID=UPI00359317E4
MNLFAQALDWLMEPANWAGAAGIWARLGEHLLLSAAAVLLAACIALPLGLYVGHTGRGAGVVGAIVGAARAIPTLGLLTLAGLFLGIGVGAPLVALVVLALPSVLAGAYAGVQSADVRSVGAAKAIGMTGWQVLSRVEVPLGLPVLLDGLRAATLQVVATATLAAYTADVGLGRFLFSGLKSRDYPLMLAAALLVAFVALILEIAFAALQKTAASRTQNQQSESRK